MNKKTCKFITIIGSNISSHMLMADSHLYFQNSHWRAMANWSKDIKPDINNRYLSNQRYDDGGWYPQAIDANANYIVQMKRAHNGGGHYNVAVAGADNHYVQMYADATNNPYRAISQVRCHDNVHPHYDTLGKLYDGFGNMST